jgi:hypothetical protein
MNLIETELPSLTTPPSPVEASRLAMIVNDDAGSLTPRDALGFIASRLAPTGIGYNPL